MMTEFLMSQGRYRATIRPGCGGLLAALTMDGLDILRPMPASSSNPLDSACFPLVPFANRISNAHFDWQGEQVQLRRNFPPEASALHGSGWQAAWEPVKLAAERCVMACDHQAADWPWDFRAIQTFDLHEDFFLATLEVANRSNRAMPAGLGFHPYFRRLSETRVTFGAGGILLTGDDQIPTGEVAEPARFGDFSNGATLPAGLIDHCYTDWNGEVVIEDDRCRVEMRAVGASCLHLYAPPGSDILCLEPVTHRPNALNQWPDDMIVLDADRSASISMLISAEAK